MSHCDFTAGWVGGMVGLLVGHPLDTIKVNQQTQGIAFRQCIQEVYKQGYKGFFRGLAFPLVAQGAMNSVFFGLYGYTLEHLNILENSRVTNKKEWEICQTGPMLRDDKENQEIKLLLEGRGQQLSYLNVGVAGCVAGFVHLIIACPIDLVKIRLQTQTTAAPKFRGPVALIKHILRTRGIRGLYQGVTTMAWRDSPSYGVYMLVYELGANKVKSWSAARNERPSSFGLFVSGGIAGTICWVMILPIDVIKSQIQSQDPNRAEYKGAMACVRHIFKEQGIKGFFRGFWSLSIRAFPVNGATLLTFAWCYYKWNMKMKS